MEYQQFRQFIVNFFEDQEIQEGMIKIKNPIEIPEKEYEELISDKKLENRYGGNGSYVDEIVKYDGNNVYAVMMIAYYRKDHKIFLTEVQLWREIRY